MTTTNFGTMLNQYLGSPLMYNSNIRDTIIMRLTKDKKRNWHNGEYIVPFEGGEQSNYQSGGGLVPKDDIQIDRYVRGKIPNYKELHGAVTFYPQDLEQHSPKTAKVPRDTFLKLVIAKTFLRAKSRFTYNFTHSILNGGALVKLTATGLAGGVVKVDHPERVSIGQKLILANTKTTTEKRTVWVQKIDINKKEITLTSNRALSTSTGGLSAFTLAKEASLFNPGDDVPANRFTSLPSQLLSEANGGDANLFGQKKADYPYLQAINDDDNLLTATREQFVFKLYDVAQNLIDYGQPMSMGEDGKRLKEDGSQAGRGRYPKSIDAIMSLRKFGVLQKYFLNKRGDYYKSTTGESVKFFDASFMSLGTSVGMNVRAVGVKAMRDDMVYFMGDDVTRFATLNYIDPYTSPDGNKWYVERNDANGYQYICDYKLYGDYIVKRPAGCAILTNLKATDGNFAS